MKGKACDEAGLYHETIRLAKETTEAELLALVERLNADHKIHGILVQLPLPKQINTQRVLHRVSPEKDVRSEEHTSELQSLAYLVCRLLLEKKKKQIRCTTVY